MADNIPKRRKRWRRLFAGLSIIAIAVILAVPWALGTPRARRWLIVRANAALAPARMDMTSIRFSWFGPTRITHLVLVDAQGDRVVDSPHATWDRNLWQVLFDGSRLGTLLLHGAALDVERLADGSIDLYEALKPVLKTKPERDLTVKVEKGHLRFRAPGVPMPVISEQTDVVVRVPVAPTPLSWRLSLANHTGATDAESLEIQGRFDHRTPAGDLEATVKGGNWPWSVELEGVAATGRLEGDVAVAHTDGRWTSSGKTSLNDLDVEGKRLQGDRLRLERVAGAWDLSHDAQRWTIRQLDVTSSIGSIKSDGLSVESGQIDGILDLAALARQIPHGLRLRDGVVIDRGAAIVHLSAEAVAGGQTWQVEARISDLAARDKQRSVTLKAPATIRAQINRLDLGLEVKDFTVETAFLTATGQGSLSEGLKASGTVNLEAFQAQLRDLVEFGSVELHGKGSFSADYRQKSGRFETQAAAGLTRLKVAGLGAGKLEREAVAFRLSARGPADDAGWPTSWEDIAAQLESGAAKADLKATRREDGVQIDATTELPLTVGAIGRQVKGRVESRWIDRKVMIDPFKIEATATDPARGGEPIRLAARGEYDRDTGELRLSPLAQEGTDAFALSHDGLRISGIGAAGKLRMAGGFTGGNRELMHLLAPDQPDAAGSWTAYVAAQSQDDGVQLAGNFVLKDLAGSEGDGVRKDEGSRYELSAKAFYQTAADRLDLTELVGRTRFGTAEASGTISDLRGRRVVDARGSVVPDWKTLNDLLSQRVEPHARVSAKPFAFRASGPLGGDPGEWVKSFSGDLAIDDLRADVYGMKVGPARVAIRLKEGRVAVEPIDTAINEGRLHLEPGLVRDDSGELILRFGPESSLKEARINDEVSRRVLSFAAPVLESATRVHGKVSVALNAAEFPLGADRRSEAKVDGSVDFQDVEFVPGPFADDLFALIGAERAPAIKLNEPVSLTIADRKVVQHGFAIPIGRATKIELAGWVDFDRNLAMKASLPLTPAMVGNVALLGDIVDGTRISVPIRGTLQKPEIDREAFKVSLSDLGKTLLGRTAGRGALELLMRLTRPRDSNGPAPAPAPPPPALTPQQRREQRMEKRAERRAKRLGAPPPVEP